MLSERFGQALAFALDLHRGQLRKGTRVPYVSHLLAVAAIVLERGGGEDEAIAALLHDAVEDQGGVTTLDEIRRRFGPAVTSIVDGCTDARETPKPPWRQRKEAHLAHLREAAPAVVLVSSADKLHNARSILADYRDLGEALWDRFRGGKEGTLWYYRALVKALRANGAPSTVDELERVVRELEALAGAGERRAGRPAPAG